LCCDAGMGHELIRPVCLADDRLIIIER
jgi:hypothetical protein